MKRNGFKHEVDEIRALITSSKINLNFTDTPSYKKCYFLENGHVLTFPRKYGDSRYVYGDNGFNFWVHASGYMYANDGLFSVFNRRKEGDEPVVAFFLGEPIAPEGNRFRRLSLLPVPIYDEAEEAVTRRYTIMNQEAAYFFVDHGSISSVVRVLVDDDHRMVFSVYLENTGTSTLSFYTSSYFQPFCRHQIYETDEDRWFCDTQLDNPVCDGNMFSPGVVEVGEDLDRFHSESHYAVLRGRFELGDDSTLRSRFTNTSRLAYMGDYKRNLSSSLALFNGKFSTSKPRTTFSDIAVLSDMNHFSLGRGCDLRLDYVFEVVNNEDERESVARQSIQLNELDEKIAEIREKNTVKLSSLKTTVTNFDSDVSIHAHDFNQFVEHLKYQVSFCGLIKGFVQLHPRSLIGIRDVFQALEGMQYYRPEDSRDKMVEALGFTLRSGRCLRQYSLPAKGSKSGVADVRQFVDQGVWVISAVHSYLQLTGDTDFLDTVVGYHEIVDEAAHTIAPCDERDSVLHHLFRIMDYLDNVRDHGETKLLRALYGDWNDALDGLGIAKDPDKEYGSGVSVMATLQLYQNCREMANILETFYPGRYSERVQRYTEIRDEISQGLLKHAVIETPNGKKKIVHGWGDEQSYFVGSDRDPDGMPRDGLTSNAFWVISGMVSECADLEVHILEAFNRLDSKYGFKTFHPPFPKGTPGVGRIPKLPPGTAENGATYVHATLFAVWALFQMGKAKEAWAQIEKTLPFTSLHGNYTHSPFVMPNSYVYNPELDLDGQSMNDWQTGSSNVLLKVLLWYVFGYKPDFDGLRLQVAAWTPFDEFQFETKLRGKSVKLSYRKDEQLSQSREFFVNGEGPFAGENCPQMKTIVHVIPYENMLDVNEIEIVDRN